MLPMDGKESRTRKRKRKGKKRQRKRKSSHQKGEIFGYDDKEE